MKRTLLALLRFCACSDMVRRAPLAARSPRARSASFLLPLFVAATGCVSAPDVILVDRKTALEEQASGRLTPLSDDLENAGLLPRAAPLTGAQLATAGGRLATQYLASWSIARLASRADAEEAMRYVSPIGEKEVYVQRARAVVVPFLIPA